MNLSFRKRDRAASGIRTNRWKGLRARRAAEERHQVSRSELLARCRRIARAAAWGAGVAGTVWVGIVALREMGPMIQRGLEIREFRIEGAHHVTTQEVLDRLALRKGIALHQVNLAYLAERLRALPWIKEATIERRPLHELRISLLERTPAAIVRVGNEHILVDEEGVVLMRQGRQDEPMLPLLTGVDLKSTFHGEMRIRRIMQSSIELARLMATTIDGRVEIDLSDPENLVASARGMRFQFGGDALVDQWNRFRMVKAVSRPTLFDGRKYEGAEVDLRYDNRVIVRERG